MQKTEEQLRETVAKNIAEFRKKAKLTQSELAQRLNYSDKSVSKWERGEGLPDLYVLSQIAEICNARPGDFFLDEPLRLKQTVKGVSTRVRVIITALAAGLVMLFATIVYFVLSIVGVEPIYLSLVYYCALPITAIVLVVFTAIWFKKIWCALSISLLIWSVAVGIWWFIPISGMHFVFEIAIALQVLTILWFALLKVRSREKKNRQEKSV